MTRHAPDHGRALPQPHSQQPSLQQPIATTTALITAAPVARCRHIVAGADGGHVALVASVTCDSPAGRAVYSVRVHYSRHDEEMATYHVESEQAGRAGRSPEPAPATLLQAVAEELRRRARVYRETEPLRAWWYGEAAQRVAGVVARGKRGTEPAQAEADEAAG